MLVMKRKAGESVILGDRPDEIRVTVVDIERASEYAAQVRLTIDAPTGIKRDTGIKRRG